MRGFRNYFCVPSGTTLCGNGVTLQVCDIKKVFRIVKVALRFTVESLEKMIVFGSELDL